MSELVKESGLSKGAFYHYFNSKKELYTHSMEMFMEHFLNSNTFDFDDSTPLRDNLKKLYQQFVPISSQMNTSTQEAADTLSNYMIFLQSLMRRKEWRVKMETYNRSYNEEFAKWIEIAQDKGEIKDELDPLLLARHLTSLMKGIGVLHAFVDQSESVDVTFGRMIDQLFDLIEINVKEK